MKDLTREEIAIELAKKSQHFYAESLLIIEEKLEGQLRCYYCESKHVILRYGTATCETLTHCWIKKIGGGVNNDSVAFYLKCLECRDEIHRDID